MSAIFRSSDFDKLADFAQRIGGYDELLRREVERRAALKAKLAAVA